MSRKIQTILGVVLALMLALDFMTVAVMLDKQDEVQIMGTTNFDDLGLGTGEALDTFIVFDGNAQDFYIALDDSADDLLIGLGAVVGTTPGLSIDEDLAVTTYGDFTFGGTTPVLTLGDGGAEDAALVYDGNAQDYYAALQDSSDDYIIGLGSTVGSTGIVYLDESQNVGLGGASAAAKLDVTGNLFVDGDTDEVQVTIQSHSTQTSTFPLVVETSAGTDRFWVTSEGDMELNGTSPTITLGDTGAEDTAVVFDGAAQDYYVALYDTADDLIIGLGSAVGTTGIIYLDETQLVGLGGASAQAKLDVTGNVFIDGDTDEAQLIIQSHSTQTSTFPLLIETSAGTDRFWVTSEGDLELNGTSPSITLGDTGAEDTFILYDGAAQDYYMALDDDVDDFLIGLGNAVGTTGIIYLDENQDMGLGAASAGAKLDVTGNVFISGTVASDVSLLVSGYSLQSVPILTVEDTNGTDILAVSQAAAAGSGGDLIDLTDTFGAMDGSDASIGIDVNLTGANHSGASNSLVGIDVDLTTADPQVNEVALDVSDADWDVAIEAGAVPIVSTAQTWMEDFFGDTLATEVVLLSGTDPQAVDPALAQEQYGVVTLVSGNVGTQDCAVDCSEMALGLHWQADQVGLVFETRLHMDTQVTDAWMCAGLTDLVTLEAPATILGSSVTISATDGVFFCYDTLATTDQWWALGVAGDTPATGNALAGVAPTADVYQVLRIEVDAGGADARLYIDGTLRGTLTANAVTASVALSPFVIVSSRTTSERIIDVDYIFVSAQRQ